MTSATVISEDAFTVSMNTGPDVKNITGEVQEAVRKSGVQTGMVSVFLVGSTGSVTTIEYESGVIEDLKRAIDGLAPPGLDYMHDRAWHDGNGHSHVQAALIGPSISLPIRGGKLGAGTWQQVVAINHDNRPRNRQVVVTVVGTRRTA